MSLPKRNWMSKNEREKLKLDRKPEAGKGPRVPDRRPKFMLWIYLAAFMALMQIEPLAKNNK